MVARPPSGCSARDSTQPRCSMIPVNIAISRIAFSRDRSTAEARGDRHGRRGCHALKAIARSPHFKAHLHLAVDVLEVGFDGYVRTELLHADIWQRRSTRGWQVREGNSCLAGKSWRKKKH